MTNFYVTTQRITLHLFHFLFYDRFIIFFVTWNGAINVKVVDITSYSLAVLLIPINALLVFGMEDTHVHEDLPSSREEEPIGYPEKKR